MKNLQNKMSITLINSVMFFSKKWSASVVSEIGIFDFKLAQSLSMSRPLLIETASFILIDFLSLLFLLLSELKP